MIDLYRHYDKDGNLLYIGISLSTVGRLSQHKTSSGWYGKISNITIEKYPTRKAAEEAEKAAIEQEKPVYNITHNKDRLHNTWNDILEKIRMFIIYCKNRPLVWSPRLESEMTLLYGDEKENICTIYSGLDESKYTPEK